MNTDAIGCGGMDNASESRLRSDLGQTWVRLGSDLGQTLVRLGSDFGQTWVGLGSELGQTWVRLGSDLGQARRRRRNCLRLISDDTRPPKSDPSRLSEDPEDF